MARPELHFADLEKYMQYDPARPSVRDGGDDIYIAGWKKIVPAYVQENQPFFMFSQQKKLEIFADLLDHVQPIPQEMFDFITEFCPMNAFQTASEPGIFDVRLDVNTLVLCYANLLNHPKHKAIARQFMSDVWDTLLRLLFVDDDFRENGEELRSYEERKAGGILLVNVLMSVNGNKVPEKQMNFILRYGSFNEDDFNVTLPELLEGSDFDFSQTWGGKTVADLFVEQEFNRREEYDAEDEEMFPDNEMFVYFHEKGVPLTQVGKSRLTQIVEESRMEEQKAEWLEILHMFESPAPPRAPSPTGTLEAEPEAQPNVWNQLLQGIQVPPQVPAGPKDVFYREDPMCYDIVEMEDMPILQALCQGSVVFKLGNNYIATDSDAIKRDLDNRKTIRFKCKREVDGAARMKDVDGTEYYLLQLTGNMLLERDPMKASMMTGRVFELVDTGTTFPYTASATSVLADGSYDNSIVGTNVNIVSADHCQAGSDRKLYSITPIVLKRATQGGKKKRRGTQRSKKVSRRRGRR